MQNIVVVVNKKKDIGLTISDKVLDYFKNRIPAVTPTMLYVEDRNFDLRNQIPDQVDCMIVLGGDGTLLQAAQNIIGRKVPLLGINLGTLGYLAEIEKNRIVEALDELMTGQYETEERMMLTGVVIRNEDTICDNEALNDIVITRGGSLQILNFNIYVNRRILKNYSADGIIISTPTGSTAYNLSAGGPIVEPSASLIVMTPICPHTIGSRSIILSPEDEVEIEIAVDSDGKERTVEVNFDGGKRESLYTGDRVRIVRSDVTTKVIKINQIGFLETLHRKMRELV